jgi:hypothetical protein
MRLGTLYRKEVYLAYSFGDMYKAASPWAVIRLP